jgi:hypothetical protein
MYTTNKQFMQILEERMKVTKKRAAERPDLSAAVRLWIRKNLLFLIIPIAALLGHLATSVGVWVGPILGSLSPFQ